MKIVYLLLVFAAFPALALYGCKVAKKQQFAASFFPKESSLYWRGIAAFMVIFAHSTSYLVRQGIDTSFARIYVWFGGMGVLIFFFVSGYGTVLSLQKKKMDLHWLGSHLLWLGAPATIIYCCFWLVIRWIHPEPSFLNFLSFALGFWFVTVLLTFYITVYIAKRFSPSHFLLVLFLLNAFTTVLFCILGLEPKWYNGHLLFVFGAFIAQYREKAQKIIRGHWYISLICSAGLFLFFALLFTKYKPAIISAVFKLISGVGLCFMLVVLSQKIVRYGSVMMKAGKTSLYMYIIHVGLFYEITTKLWPTKPYLVVFLSLAVTLPLAMLCLKLETMARNSLQKK